VAEPEITRQGNTVVVNLPGVTDQARAVQIVGQTATLRFRPVLQRTLGEDCAVVMRPDPTLGPVLADAGQLEQVLLNLALNARDAMPLGGTLTVETSAVELPAHAGNLADGVSVRPGRYALLAVSDTGHGMDKATLAHAFEPFYTTKGVGQGTGLGLATVYGIVKQSDGYVWADSEPSQGTTIRVYLPLTEARSEPPAAGRPAELRASGELVLVVEDDAPVRAIAARVLAEAGYRVLEAESGARALELLEATLDATKDRLSLLFTDVVMPGMSGPELAAEVTRVAPGTPVLFTSGYTNGEIFRRGLLAPGAAFLAKPFTPEALVREVRARAASA
jgi:CheY-like chemotaxis protein